jgi:hypothetical protein
MKTLFKSTLIAASVAVLGINAASADDSQLQTRLALTRQSAQRSQPTPSIAVYARERGVGQVQRASTSERKYVWKTRQVGNSSTITYRAPAE